MTKDKINIKDLSPHLKKLVDRLNCRTNYNEDTPKDSIMHYGQLCNHDDGFLCEHRLEYILNYLRRMEFEVPKPQSQEEQTIEPPKNKGKG